MSARDDLMYWANEGLREWGHDGRDGDIRAWVARAVHTPTAPASEDEGRAG